MANKQIQKTLRKRQVRLVDVAQAAGVSRWVAGQVLNGGDGNSRASAEAEVRIRQVADELGYRPNHAAQLLHGKRSNMFGVLVASAGDPLRSFLVQFLDLEAVKIGCHSLIGNTISRSSLGPDQF
ncbi:MAG: LacI family transcriptional regulator, partial [bacterium]|nr:LacI family transcriptional regulator [bacterium]